jgi:hypothetical protein
MYAWAVAPVPSPVIETVGVSVGVVVGVGVADVVGVGLG